MPEIKSLTHHGLGRTEDGTLIPRTLPGEVVEEGRILTPSPHRVKPSCRHFKTCGGCTMQHASDDFVAEWKTSIVTKALQAQGLETDMRPIQTSPPQSRRRAKLSGIRTKSGALVGFHRQASDQIVAIPDCQILSPALKATLPALEALTRLAASRKTEVDLTVTDSLGGPDILVSKAKSLTRDLREAAARLVADHALARLVWNDEPIADTGTAHQQFGKARVVPPPGAFLQATREGEAALLSATQEITAGATRIADLFSGCGTFTLPLAETAEIHAVEAEAAMLKALDAGWRNTPGLKRVTTEPRDLFRRPLDAMEIRPFDAIVIDPPRAGAAAQTEEIAKAGPPVIAGLSCNPVTFARDARRLTEGGYQLDWVQPIDQFRWSAHLELAARFTRA
ncbi:class I SAM-dependent RNA methyltransferase [Aestuariibius sp. 2305UL40-4]|uniref:class I SAM-dependent RNA methyltransferase n=1 Tax=Aestuariibius violaceus TaxID=3234132 RepID=UPI00345E0D5C